MAIDVEQQGRTFPGFGGGVQPVSKCQVAGSRIVFQGEERGAILNKSLAFLLDMSVQIDQIAVQIANQSHGKVHVEIHCARTGKRLDKTHICGQFLKNLGQYAIFPACPFEEGFGVHKNVLAVVPTFFTLLKKHRKNKTHYLLRKMAP